MGTPRSDIVRKLLRKQRDRVARDAERPAERVAPVVEALQARDEAAPAAPPDRGA